MALRADEHPHEVSGQAAAGSCASRVKESIHSTPGAASSGTQSPASTFRPTRNQIKKTQSRACRARAPATSRSPSAGAFKTGASPCSDTVPVSGDAINHNGRSSAVGVGKAAVPPDTLWSSIPAEKRQVPQPSSGPGLSAGCESTGTSAEAQQPCAAEACPALFGTPNQPVSPRQYAGAQTTATATIVASKSRPVHLCHERCTKYSSRRSLFLSRTLLSSPARCRARSRGRVRQALHCGLANLCIYKIQIYAFKRNNFQCSPLEADGFFAFEEFRGFGGPADVGGASFGGLGDEAGAALFGRSLPAALREFTEGVFVTVTQSSHTIAGGFRVSPPGQTVEDTLQVASNVGRRGGPWRSRRSGHRGRSPLRRVVTVLMMVRKFMMFAAPGVEHPPP